MDLQQLQVSLTAFSGAVRIQTDGGVVPWAEVADPFQVEDLTELDNGTRLVVDQPLDETLPVHSRAWIERSRGHSKTLDLSIVSAYMLFASRRQLSGVAAAASRDQSRLLRDALLKLVRLNDWLEPLLEIQQNKIVNRTTGSELIILSSDAHTAYGQTPDFLICDEVSHWQNQDLWTSLISSAAKRSSCMVVCILNAGFESTWQAEVRESVQEDSAWFFSRVDGSVASWISAKHLDEQRKLLPPAAFARLWENVWSSGGGDALSVEDINAAFFDNLKPMLGSR